MTSNFTVEQKSLLAKLMATENLTIQHEKTMTARFDPINRVLYLPIWQNMSGHLYDHLTGHEVGHALYTPADGWHNAVTKENKGQNYKGFLNVIEDARIEKKVKRKYPGLKTPFQKSFSDLMARDFFGVKDRELDSLPFIDRLNLFSKSQWTMDLEFSDYEKSMITKVQNCETWDDVLRVTEEIYDYSKDEQQQTQNSDEFVYSNFDDSDSDDAYDYDSSDGENEFEETDTDDSMSESDQDGEEESEGESGDSESDDEADGLDEKDGKNLNRDKESNPYLGHNDPICKTDENYRKNEMMLLDSKCKNYVYHDIPKPILQNIFTPAKRVHELMEAHYNTFDLDDKSSYDKLVAEFKKRNERYVSLLAKEFEMRKAARAYSKAKISNTGDIDFNRLASYRIDDNIFRKMMTIPKGKSHGLVLLLDCSGSMSNNMAGSIEQILILTMFCRKVNIPFEVIGFSDNLEVHALDTNHKGWASDLNRSCPSFERKSNTVDLGYVRLRQYLSSKMPNTEFSKAMRNLILLKCVYDGTKSRSFRPQSEQLSNTPLTQAIVATGDFMKEFKEKNSLDFTSLVIVHDGDADETNYYAREETNRNDEKVIISVPFDYYRDVNIIRDRRIQFEYVIQRSTRYEKPVCTAVYEWFRKYTGSKIFNFFLVNNRRADMKNAIYRLYNDEQTKNLLESGESRNGNNYLAHVMAVSKIFREKKYLITEIPGTNNFYMLLGGDELETEEDKIEIEGKITTKKLTNAFLKMNKKKSVSRTFVTKFIEGIAA